MELSTARTPAGADGEGGVCTIVVDARMEFADTYQASEAERHVI